MFEKGADISRGESRKGNLKGVQSVEVDKEREDGDKRTLVVDKWESEVDKFEKKRISQDKWISGEKM